MSGEAACLTDIRIPAEQRALLEEMCALGKPVVLVVMAGRPLDLSRESEIASSILMAWQGGIMTADALYDILYGAENPSGRLTTSFPRNVGQIPVYHYMLNTGRPATDGKNDRFTSRYLDCWNAPLYPFGYGLSYTQFEYSDVTLSGTEMDANGSITATVTVSNIGKVAGEEVVQLYLRDKVGSVSRPVKQLKGFEKISLKPGESQTISFKINEEMLRFWKADMTYGSEKGEFVVMIGPDASISKGQSFWLK
jgi:beta-glucosidase